MSTWQERLKEAVENDPRSKRELAAELDMGSQYIYQITQGKTPAAPKLFELCELLGVDPVYIMTGEGTPEGFGDFMKVFAGLNADNRAILLKVARGFADGQK
ncbi:helix-turn-helix domain-containing protein [Flexibacterium corallicola]|uniref:helix-turn-helix domain-containing protein n=1 Tax=Flexibacterium corallicola TaxID=3037259 RepID=UPI00286F7E6C|nr:helix-turn-helix transcriptional regulator [Pseudovibrio sp. M1P-2-3]